MTELSPLSLDDLSFVDEDEEDEEKQESLLDKLSIVDKEKEPEPKKTSVLDSLSTVAQEPEPVEEELKIEDIVPKGVIAGEYTPSSMVEDDRLYKPIKEYMDLRYGIQSTEGQSRQKIVDRYINNRRGNMIGNSVRALSEADFLYDIRNDEKKMAIAGRAYGIYQNMANSLTSDKASLGEKVDSVVDGVRAAVFDPLNLAAGVVGKAVGGTATKVGVKSLNNLAMKAAMNELKKQGTKAGAKQAASKVYKKAILSANKQASDEIGEYALKLSSTKGFKRVMTRAGLKEVGGTMLVDALAATGTEYLYQKSLIDTGVQDDLDWTSVGISSLTVMGIGGLQALRVAKRGTSKQTLVSEALTKATPKEVADELRLSLIDFINKKQLPKTSAFAEKVAKGVELKDKDTKFFVELLLGRTDDEGKVLFKGLGQIMQEKGFVYIQRTDDDNVSNFVADFLATMDKKDIQGILKATGSNIKGLNKVTPEQFSNIFANKISQGGETLSAVAQVANRMELDLEKIGLDKYLKDAMGMSLLEQPPSRFDKWGGAAGSNVRKLQNNMIRSLVSHPSTSMLNVIGYGTASSINTASDMVQALLYASRGTLENLVGMTEKGASHMRMAKALTQANLNRGRLLLDPDMTQEAFKSALLRNTGALEKLSRVQAGGVDISKGIDEMTELGELNRSFWFQTEKGIDAIQAMTLVDAQDIFTKSQEYMFQMDKNIRVAFNMSFDDFYKSKDATRLMATKQYRQIEANAVDKVLEATFGKSFKDKTALGQVAGFIEDARNIPGLGALVPFGKFFNNTVNFTIKNSPLSLAAKVGGNYKDVTFTELSARMLVSGGLVYSFAKGEEEKRRQGLGLYDVVDGLTGEVRSIKYDYPLSLFQAAGRIHSMNQAGEEIPDGMISEIIVDFFGGSLTKNITKSGDVMLDGVKAILQQDLELAMEKGTQSVTSIGAQFGSAYTRFLEPLNETIGLAFPDQVNRVPTVGEDPSSKKLKNTFRYIDNLAELVTGKGSDELRQTSALGEANPQSSKMVGFRTVTNTDTMRIMNMIGAKPWELNAAFKISQLTPIAGNRFQKEYFNLLEEQATYLMSNKNFRSNMSIKQQTKMWKMSVSKAKDAAISNLMNQSTEKNRPLLAQYMTATDYSVDDIKEGLKELDIEKDFYELDIVEIETLNNYLSTKDLIDDLEILKY